MGKRKRNRYVGFRLTEEEWQDLDHIVAGMGISKERYLRNLAKRIVPRHLPSEDMKEILSQLRHIGNNMNQIARAANKAGHPDTVLYKENFTRLQGQISRIMEILMEPSYVVEDLCP